MTLDDHLFFNGRSAVDGEPVVPPLRMDGYAELIRRFGRKLIEDDDDITRLRAHLERRESQLGGPVGIAPEDPTQAGWGVVFAKGEAPDVRDALSPLIAHRERQVRHGHFHVLEYDGEDWVTWLNKYGAGTGSWNPKRVPFYLLIVGDPETIPFSFSQPLSRGYCIGRLSFPTAREYGIYAENVIACEEGQVPRRARRVDFFATRHDFDEATQLSADYLVGPLAEAIEEEYEVPTTVIGGQKASRNALVQLLGQDAAILFTATHGLGFRGHPHQ